MQITFVILILFGYFLFQLNIEIVHKKHFVHRPLTKIGIVYAFWSCLLFIFRDLKVFWVAIWVLLPCFLAILANFCILNVRRNQKWVEKKLFLDRFILLMYQGHSFRGALTTATRLSSALLAKEMRQVTDIVTFSMPQKDCPDPFFTQFLEQCQRADQQAHKALSRFEMFRRKVQTESEFRRKSGQVTWNTRFQAIVMAGLYLATVLFMGQRFGFRNYVVMLAVSCTLFIVGTGLIFILGQKNRWKV